MSAKRSGSAKKWSPPGWGGAEIRARFVAFFESRQHHRMPSSSLIPHDDPTVLLTTAGMQQMIPYFLGKAQPPASRLTSVQKCFRTTDIDEVGDASHLTFFEMLGNFSVGDYFKREAIGYAWELLTKGYGLPADRLYPTVHPDDVESPGYWHEVAGVDPEAITRLSDNWWGPPGESGPCGPDSEIYFDRGIEYSCGNADCAPGCDRCDRFLEVWNLVFMQYEQAKDGSRTPLKKQNIDTGMGLERLSMVLQGRESIYETDLFRPIIEKFAALVGTTYGQDPEHDRSLRVIADHGRALVFLAADGVLPGNEGRGYIFRRVLRRAVRHGRLLGIEGPFLAEAADTVIELFKGHYAELEQRRQRIMDVLSVEEKKFSETLARGLQLLARELEGLKREGSKIVPGELAFKLYDTHGFPLELTEELANDQGFTVDRIGFDSAMQRQQETARQAAGFVRAEEEHIWTGISKSLPPTRFLGYNGTEGSSEILALVVDGSPVDAVSAPQRVAVVLAETPFYAEAGGQQGDHGVIATETGALAVSDTQRPVPGLIVHYGVMKEGHLRVGESVQAQADLERRQAIMRNHSATHLLHRALKDVLGEHVNQQGSLVAPDRLRFDFSHTKAVSHDEMAEIDRRVNQWVLENHPVETRVMAYKEALATGAMALFGEKYGDEVRVVTMGTSKELCGGTHVGATGQIGLYLTTSEASSSASVRRVEALTGTGALGHLRQRADLVTEIAKKLDIRPEPDAIVERLGQMREENAEARRKLAEAQRAQAREEAARLAASPRRVGETPLVVAAVSVPDDKALREMGDAVRSHLGPGVIVLASRVEDQARFIVTIDAETTSRGLHAGKIAQIVGEALGGRGGGRADSAQGGGKAVQRLDSITHITTDALKAASK